MEWTDEGIVLGVRRHGESSAIVELLTRSHGRHLGLVRGGAGSRMRPLLQPGNSVRAVWRARLDEHLGYYAIEGTRLRAATLLGSSHATYGVTHLASLARLLPERDPHQDIYEMLERTLDDFDDAGAAAAHLIRFELAMLAELGFRQPKLPLIRVLPDSPKKSNASPWENDKYRRKSRLKSTRSRCGMRWKSAI